MITPSPVTARTFRIGIVGCGAISRNHLEAFRALVKACDDAGEKLGVLFQRRFWPYPRRRRTGHHRPGRDEGLADTAGGLRIVPYRSSGSLRPAA
ncbi:hypothetical protein [Arthrobacter sp. PAMC25564]|uniref:hypothetical protein n=1 Tax=Arthrobacter sp. PAMC25564 TaxID=2565366 RepID=UPI00197BC418|nr:hypothetical protein [Arthrobacter sp. PAMC25564]